MRRIALLICAACPAIALAGCGGSHPAPAPPTITVRVVTPPATAPATTPATTATSTPIPPPAPHKPARLIAILPAASRQGTMPWTPLAAVRGVVAAWISRVPAHAMPGLTVTLVRYDQSLVRLALHAGTEDPGGSGWRYGAAIGAAEGRAAITAFNSAFRPSYGAGGFMQDGRIGWPLHHGAATVVIYKDGLADIGTWQQTVPQPGRPVAAARQNLTLLIDHGRAPSSVDTCIKACWGDPLHEQPDVARSALGITPDGMLVWAAGETLSVRALADALIGAGVTRAMELDINPAWVAGYAYPHARSGSPLTPISLVPGQKGVPGQFLQDYYRDFFSILARP
jgi:hypothetical protein